MRVYFNPRTPDGVRLKDAVCIAFIANISIHAPLTGCDRDGRLVIDEPSAFQSTHP